MTYRSMAENQEKREAIYLKSENDSIANMRERHEMEAKRDQQAISEFASVAPSLKGWEVVKELKRKSLIDSLAITQQTVSDFLALAKEYKARAAYHGRLKRKYAEAARQPWWGGPPDPIVPDWDRLYPKRPVSDDFDWK